MTIRCIYCLKDKPRNEYQRREHVMPQCYGTFTPNNLVLYETVCDVCNQYFGDEIELYLGRDTIEGVIRYRYGKRPKRLPKGHKRLKFKIAEGELEGMLVKPIYPRVPGETDTELLPQVGFFNRQKQKYVFLSLRIYPIRMN